MEKHIDAHGIDSFFYSYRNSEAAYSDTYVTAVIVPL